MLLGVGQSGRFSILKSKFIEAVTLQYGGLVLLLGFCAKGKLPIRKELVVSTDLQRPVALAITRFSWSGRSKVQISGRSNWTHCCQRLATAVIFLQKELCCPQAQ